MRSAQLVQSRHAGNIAILEMARTAYDGIHQALMQRIAGGLDPGSLSELPIALIDALYTDISVFLCAVPCSAQFRCTLAPLLPFFALAEIIQIY